MEFSESLKKSADFKNAYKNGASRSNRLLVMYAAENHLGKNRLGISVSKKVGNSVVRHRLSRLVRESYRLHEEMFDKGFDIVAVLRVNAKDASYREIKQALLHLAFLLSLVK